MDKTWTIVKFLDENTVEAVPTNWVVGNMCYWPPFTREKVIHSIRNYEEPNTCWPSHKISIFRNGTFNDYLQARNKTKVAEYSSDLNNDDSKSRKYRKKRNTTSSDEESEEESHKIPPPPSKPTTKPSVQVSLQSQNEAPKDSPVIPPTSSGDCCCCPVHGRQVIDEQMKKIMKQYYFISNVLTDISSKLENIHINRPSIEDVDSLFIKFSFFPLKNAENLTEIEDYLENVTNFKAACDELSKVGGNNLYEFIKRIMSQLLTNSLASTYSLHGRKNKLKFMGLKIADLIINAAGKYGKGNVSQKEIEESIMKWLRRASERK